MPPEHTALGHAIAAERARLLVLLWRDIAALRQLVDESRQLVVAARHSMAAVRLLRAEQDAHRAATPHVASGHA